MAHPMSCASLWVAFVLAVTGETAARAGAEGSATGDRRPAGAEAQPAGDAPAGTPTQPVAHATAIDYAIVVTGSELLEGAYPDGHTWFLTRTLRLLGCRCVGSFTVGDQADDLKRVLRFASAKARLVIVTGGLGPTVNDVTREMLSEFTGIPLHEQPEVLGELARRFHQSENELRANLRRQARVPSRGTYFANSLGTAVGLVFDAGDTTLVALPGPPRELQPMVKDQLVPFLHRRFGVRPVGCSLTLRFVGIGQSLIDQTMRDHGLLPSDVLVSSAFEGSRVDFTLALPGDTPEDRARLRVLEARIAEHLGEYLYADDGSSLEEGVVRGLLARGGTLVLAEVGSGGHLAASLDSVTNIARLLVGAYAAPTDEQMRQIVGVPPSQWSAARSGAARVRAIARAAAEQAHSRWAIAVGETGEEDGDGPGVWLVFGSTDGEWVAQRVAGGGSGELAHANLSTRILDRLRRQLK